MSTKAGQVHEDLEREVWAIADQQLEAIAAEHEELSRGGGDRGGRVGAFLNSAIGPSSSPY